MVLYWVYNILKFNFSTYSEGLFLTKILAASEKINNQRMESIRELKEDIRLNRENLKALEAKNIANEIKLEQKVWLQMWRSGLKCIKFLGRWETWMVGQVGNGLYSGGKQAQSRSEPKNARKEKVQIRKRAKGLVSSWPMMNNFLLSLKVEIFGFEVSF